MIASPLVAVINRVRKPIRPRAGIVNSRCVNSPPALHLHALRLPFQHQRHDRTDVRAGTSTTRYSTGSIFWPFTSLMITFGLPTESSESSRRMFSRRIDRCNSPRPETMILIAPFAGPHAHGDIALQLLIEPVAQFPAGERLAFLAGEGRIVDAEHHVERRLVDGDRRQGFRVVEVRDRVADVRVVQADHGANVAGREFLGLLSPQPVEFQHLHNGVVDSLAVLLFEQCDSLALADLARD